jgi:hypothetical protein
VVTLVIWLFDPAEAAMRRQLPRAPRRSPLWWMRRSRRTGVDTEDDERVAALEAMWSSREYRERLHAAREAAMRATRDRWGAQARICADDLVRDGATVMRLDTDQIYGRILRFWRGDSLLDLKRVGPAGESRGSLSMRLRRGQDADRDLLAFYLVQQAIDD